MPSFEDYLFTKNTKWVIWGVGTLIFGLLIFHAGVVVGQHEHEPHGGAFLFRGGFPSEAFMHNGYGVVGSIASTSLPTMTIVSRDGNKQVVYVGSSTVINGVSPNAPQATTSSLTPGTFVIIIGDPNDTDDHGEIDARIIRILPPPPLSQSSQ